MELNRSVLLLVFPLGPRRDHMAWANINKTKRELLFSLLGEGIEGGKEGILYIFLALLELAAEPSLSSAYYGFFFSTMG